MASAKQQKAERPKRKFLIDWRIEGTFEVDATSAKEAQKIFDEAIGNPSGLMPMRDGKFSNDNPEPRERNL